MAQAFGLPGEDELEFQRVERRRQLANMLAGDAMSPIQNMGTGPYASPISPFQGLQKMLAGYLAGRGMNKADEAQKALVQGRQEKFGKAFDYLDQLRQPQTGAISQPPQVAAQPGGMTVAPPEGGEVKPFNPPQPEASPLQDPRLPPVTDPNDPNRLVDLGNGNYQLRPVAPTLPDSIQAPEVGVTGQKPEVETPELFMRRVAIAAQKAGVSPQAFMEFNPMVKATYDQLVADAKDTRDYRRQEDLARLGSTLRLGEQEAGRKASADDIVSRFSNPATGEEIGVTRDGRTKVIGKVGSKPTDLVTLGPDGKPVINEVAVQAQERVGKARASNISVNTALEKKEQEAQGTANVKMTMDEIRPQAEAARKANAHINTMLNVINRGDFQTGFAGPTRAAVDSFFSFLGSPEAAKRATDAQTFQAAAMEIVLQKQLAQKGPQTDSDAKRIADTGAQLKGTPQANRYVLSLAKASNDRDIARYNFMRNWWSKFKTYEGAESAWYGEGEGRGIPDAGRGGRSLFDEPALSMYRSGRVEEGPKGGGGWKIEKVN